MTSPLLLVLLGLALAANDPQVQIHVAVGQVPGFMTFTWSTRSATPTTYVRITTGSTWTNFAGTTRNFTDGSNSWVIHSASAQLSPNTVYQYQVGCIINGFSSSYSVQVPPDQAAANFLLFGDLATDANGANSWTDIAANAKNWLASSLIVAGDMAYDLSTSSSTVGDDFMTTLQPVVHYIPMQVAAGNHEATDNYYNYIQRFDMPNNKFWYTFTVGYVRFLAIHTEAFITEVDKLPDMLPYIQNVLNRSPADKQAYPWLVVFGHRPMYCCSDDKPTTCGTEANSIKQYLEDWFKNYNVDLYVNGHVHNYQRTAPVYKGQVTNTYTNPRSTIYVTTGGPGADKSDTNFDCNSTPSWLVASEDSYSFSVMNVYNKTHLYWQQIKTKNNNVVDSFWIIKTSS
jgi:acid phosphatase type 7